MNILDELQKIGWYPNRKVVTIESSKFKCAVSFIETYGGLRYSNNSTNTHYQFATDFNVINLGGIEFVTVGLVTNPISGTLGIAISEYEEVYVLDYEEYYEKIATIIEMFFEKIFSDNFSIPNHIDKRALEELHKSGWFTNRKIDISNMYNYITSNGLPFFKVAYDFFESFYNLSGITWGEDSMTWRILNEYDIVDKKYISRPNALSYLKEIYMPICTLDNGLINYYITVTGKIYNEMGSIVGNNVMEGINSILRL